MNINNLVALGNNRVNSSGDFSTNQTSRTSGFYSNVILPGVTLPIPVSGTSFYLVNTTGVLSMRPSNGIFTDYAQGTGLELLPVNAFNLLEAKNNSASAIAFTIFYGFDGFIDNRLILIPSPSIPTITFPTYPVANVSALILIPDLSGSIIADQNGNNFLAISRIAIQIYNTGPTDTIFLCPTNFSAPQKHVACAYPLTSVRHESSGGFSIRAAAVVDGIVNELYNATRA